MTLPTTQERALTPVDRLKSVMNSSSVQEQFKNCLGENSSLFVASIIDLFASDTYLQKCPPNLVVLECLKAAVLKLPINKSLGFAYVVPYKDVPQFQIGYRGLIQLAMRSGIYRIINADVVLDGELLGVSKLTGEVNLDGQAKSGEIIGYFAHIETTNGFKKTLYMSKPDVAAHGAKYSKSYAKESSPWKKNFDQMATKTVLRLLLGKYGQLSVEMATAMESDDEALSPAGQLEEATAAHANQDFVDIQTGEITPQDQSVVNESFTTGQPATGKDSLQVGADDGPGF